MDRRDFLATCGGLVVLASLAGLQATIPFNQALETDAPDLESVVGPVLVEGLTYLTKTDVTPTVTAYYGQTAVFEVDPVGQQLLLFADGKHSVEQIAAAVNPAGGVGEVCDFYLALGQAGYLQNQFLVATTETFV
jgi:hypothetical protein